jgi:hypothetical protein
MRIQVLGFIYLLLFSFTTQAQKFNFTETWYDKTPVSGDIRVGIINEVSNELINPFPDVYYAYIDISTTEKDSLCTVISSRDGRYKGQLSHALTEDMKGKISNFEWPSKYQNKLSEMKKSEITMISYVAETCDSDAKYYTLSQWDNSKAVNLYIALNSEKKPFIKIKTEGEKDKTYKCQKIEDETNVNYNYICKVPVDQVSKAYEVLVVQRVVRLSSFHFIDYELDLKVLKND